MMSNPYLSTLAYFVVCAAILLISFFVIESTTKYKDWEEIKKGNVAVTVATGGKLLGISIILYSAIASTDTLAQTAIWGVIGLVMLIIVYFVFNWVTPKIDIDKAIGDGNLAVGLLSAFISVVFSLIIGGSIS